ncbi:MAG: KilA-N domain-containing protein [Proteiniphilum sp.]|nr:KilA-N domain-containing protein [Proteiniphilum sp.]MDD3908717.1 KilA-N domain-containing protein [Proteiniphilum sp.]
MAKGRILQVKESEITVISQQNTDYISLTDMAITFRKGSGLIGKWITNKNTIEYLGVWERVNNPDFNYPEFGVIGQEAGTNRFIMSVGQWIDRTKAIGMLVKAGRYGGTYAHKDIAFHFAMWLSPKFQIYLVNEFQRLKDEENNRLKLEWNLQRTLAKVNYQIASKFCLCQRSRFAECCPFWSYGKRVVARQQSRQPARTQSPKPLCHIRRDQC